MPVNVELSEVFKEPLRGREVPWSELGKQRFQLRRLEIGGRVETDSETRSYYLAAKQVGIRITGRKLPKGGWIYERIA